MEDRDASVGTKLKMLYKDADRKPTVAEEESTEETKDVKVASTKRKRAVTACEMYVSVKGT